MWLCLFLDFFGVIRVSAFHQHIYDAYSIDQELATMSFFPARNLLKQLALKLEEMKQVVSLWKQIAFSKHTLGFSFFTRFRIFSSRRRRPGSRGPRPSKRL